MSATTLAPPAPPIAAGPTKPTRWRSPALDVLRGLAILGTLMANIWMFSGPTAVRSGAEAPRDPGVWESAVSTFTDLFIDGKWLGLLTIMFGIGLEIQRQAAIRRGETWPGKYPWRAGLLVLDGLLNYLFIFQFDVLMGYGLTALVVCFVLATSPRFQRIWLGVAVAVHLGHLTWTSGLLAGGRDTGMDADSASDVPNRALTAAEQADLQAMAEQADTASWWAQVTDRFDNFWTGRGEIPVMFTMGMGLFLVGAHLYRAGILQPHANRLRAWVAGLGFGLGVPLDWYIRLQASDLSTFARYFTSSIIALGILATIAHLYARGREVGIVGKALSVVGRMALTCYLLQNLLCSILFYDWGFGLANAIPAEHTTTATLIGWCVVAGMLIGFSALWLRHFDKGPAELLWAKVYDLLPPRRRARHTDESPRSGDAQPAAG